MELLPYLPLIQLTCQIKVGKILLEQANTFFRTLRNSQNSDNIDNLDISTPIINIVKIAYYNLD